MMTRLLAITCIALFILAVYVKLQDDRRRHDEWVALQRMERIAAEWALNADIWPDAPPATHISRWHVAEPLADE